MNAPTPERWKVVLAFLAIYVIWGSTYFAIRLGIETMPPLTMAGVRFTIAGVILALFCRVRGARWPDLRAWRSAAIVGTLLLLGGNGGVCWAQQRVPSGWTALLIAATPIWFVLLGRFGFGGSRVTPFTIAGLASGIAGILILSRPGQFAGAAGVDPTGALVIVVATLSWATGSMYSRRARLPEPPLFATALEMLTGGGALLLVAALSGDLARVNVSAISLRSGLALVYLIVFGSLIAFSAYLWLLRVVSPVKVGTYAYVNPIVAVILGTSLLGEPINSRVFLAGGFIFAAVTLIQWESWFKRS